MKFYSTTPSIILLLLLSLMSSLTTRASDTLDFTGRLANITPENIFHEDGYYVWCGSAIKGEDEKYYLFYSRWNTGSEGRAVGDEQLFKDMKGWLKYSEIAVAVAESPTGPFKPLKVVLRGTNDKNRWDQFSAHNVHIKRFGNKVYLYYISNHPVKNNDHWMQYADGQRIGVIIADSVKDIIAGRFTRSATPLIAPDGKNTFCRTVNPSVTQGRDGRYLMMFKSRSAAKGGFMTHWIAVSDQPDGPFTLAGPALTDARYDAEDPYFWFDRDRDCYYAIVKDFSRKERGLSPQFGALALITSNKGWGDWKPATRNLVSLREYTDTTGRKHELTNLERPQLLFDQNEKPICLYTAAGEKDPFKGTPSFNLAIPIRPIASVGAPVSTPILKSTSQSDPDSLKRLANMRFGVMFHWGPAVLRDNEISWSMSNRETYESVYAKFNPSHFDADDWASIAVTSGARYIIYVCKHHDGFCMWDTKTTDNNIMNTPMKRDVTGELAAACKKHQIVFGTYLSIMDIHEAKWDRCYPARTDMPGYPEGIPHIADITEKQTLELLKKYNSQLMWYDGAWLEGWRTGNSPSRVVSAIKSYDPKVLVTRLGNNVDDFECMEAKIGAYRPTPWEMVTSVAYPTYSYNTRIKYKTPKYFIQTLSRVACGNGNLLLNFIPDADGAIPTEQLNIAKEIGAWLKDYGSAIYGTLGGPWYPGLWGGSTHNGHNIYVHLLPDAPDKLLLPLSSANILSARILNGEIITIRKLNHSIELAVPISIRNPNVTIVELTMDSDVNGMIESSKPHSTVKKLDDGIPVPREERLE